MAEEAINPLDLLLDGAVEVGTETQASVRKSTIGAFLSDEQTIGLALDFWARKGDGFGIPLNLLGQALGNEDVVKLTTKAPATLAGNVTKELVKIAERAMVDNEDATIVGMVRDGYSVVNRKGIPLLSRRVTKVDTKVKGE